MAVFLAVLAAVALRLALVVRDTDPPMPTGLAVVSVLLLALLIAGSVAVALYGVWGDRIDEQEARQRE